jgi:hypothetical protein
VTVTEIPTSATFYEYRGELYRGQAFGDTWVNVFTEGVKRPQERFPDALEFRDHPHGSWVKLPRSVLDATFDRTVEGRWRGAPVTVLQLIMGGPDKGRVRIIYAGGDPAVAASSGFLGSQYTGWDATVDPSEVEIVKAEMVLRPVVEQ